MQPQASDRAVHRLGHPPPTRGKQKGVPQIRLLANPDAIGIALLQINLLHNALMRF
ncbi:hypothetical protein XYCOK13_19960 [Xylanibacillus composti]|uniref:Uncharacterized protein n=1 Tax=Xylanibacillus composti TaxID=1572762 RepID=A0A8J4M2Q4_9BACL|nr:hypothetical protein XYCOK13_19960 [Xylanibacillus composti]